jgi:16S rRNA processing protein RimM
MIYIGNLVNTHGIKGEVRIISDFKYKDIIFKKHSYLYIDNDKLEINSYRTHKNYDMVTFNGFNNINDVLKYKGKKVYISEDEFTFPDILPEKLIGFKVYSDKKIGEVSDVIKTKAHEILIVKNDKGTFQVPYVKSFIKEIKNDIIYINVIEGLINED